MGTRWTTLLLLLAAAIIGGITALGLDHALHHGSPPVGMPDPGHRRHPPDARWPAFDPAGHFARELGLSPGQQAGLDSVLARHRDEMEQIREATRPRYDSIAERTSREIDSLLTPEQRRILDSIRAGRPRGGRSAGHPPSWH